MLIIDDEMSVRSVMGRIVESFGFEGLTAATGDEGMRAVQERQSELRCVLLDLTLPGESGIEIYDRIRELTAAVPIVFITGYDDQEVFAQLDGRDVSAILQKPFDLDRIRNVLMDVAP